MGEITINPLHNVHKQYRQMIFANPYRFGMYVPPITNNTFIGGVASVINTPALLAAKLQNYPSGTAFSAANIQNFTIVGSNIECYIGVDYQIAIRAFWNNTIITYYRDTANYCKKLVGETFGETPGNLAEIQLEGVISMGTKTFTNQNKIKRFIFPNLTTITGGYQFFSGGGASNAIFYVPNLLPLAQTTGLDQLFYGTSGFKLYANLAIQTNNAGNPDGDIADLIAKGGNVTYVLNFTAPSAITNLSIGTIYATALKLNFTAPSSANTIDFYEVWVNGKYNNKGNASGLFAVGLTPNTSYQIEVKPVDIYYNKSTSNIVTQATAATYYVDTASLVSYYKMENNVLDSWGANNGTPTAITYASGLVGQTAVFNGTTSQISLGNPLNLSLQQGAVVCVLNTSNAGSSYRALAVKRNAYGLYVKDGILSTYSWSGTVGDRLTGINVNDGLNHIVVMNFDWGVTDGTKIWLDSNLVLTATTGGTDQLSTVIIGNGDSRTQFFNEKIDEVSIFNKALTEAEVSEITAKLNSGQSLI